MEAILQNQIKIAQYLVQAGEKIGHRHLALATECGHVEIVRWILIEKSGLELSASLLRIAVKSGNVKLTTLYFNRGLKESQIDQKGNTYLHYAVGREKLRWSNGFGYIFELF